MLKKKDIETAKLLLSIKNDKPILKKKSIVKEKKININLNIDDIMNVKRMTIEPKALSKSMSNVTITMFDAHIKNKEISKQMEEGLRQYTHDYCSTGIRNTDSKSNVWCYVSGCTIKEMYMPVYIAKRKDLVMHMDCKSSIGSEEFVKKIKEKKLKRDGKYIKEYNEIAYLKPQELFTEKWEKEINRKNIREEKSKNIATSNLYTCGSCGCKKTIVSTPTQLRSPDEPMTTYVTCSKCSKVFKV
jgi:DNA-directed RNA polymerase subunit M/transcription elongation factor TFIIS